jgi:hypothetical protein
VVKSFGPLSVMTLNLPSGIRSPALMLISLSP